MVKDVGIKAIEVYLPSQFVDQAELEKHDGVSAGKYTIGLGQKRMGFVNDREDIYSLALTALSRLLTKNNILPNQVGRLEVGTETLLDKSKSVKSVLMQLMGENGDIDGIDTVNACYGGTNALFNAINWVYSPSYDGRLAIVVAGDIAIYSKGAARPTGGAGIVAMVIGPDAPLVVDPIHGTYMEHAYDFYKPDFTSEYPVVDGHFSLACYTKAVDQAYRSYNLKNKSKEGLGRFAYSAFHVPTCKLVTKSYARLLYNDYLADSSAFAGHNVPEEFKTVDEKESLTNRDIEKVFLGIAKPAQATSLDPSLVAASNTGNIYTGSLYLSLASLLAHVQAEDLSGKRISMFSYGSGLAASFFSIAVSSDVDAVAALAATTNLKEQLDNRAKVSPTDYEAALALREKAHLQKEFEPKGSIEHLRKGTYYLVKVDDKFRREYAQK